MFIRVPHRLLKSHLSASKTHQPNSFTVSVGSTFHAGANSSTVCFLSASFMLAKNAS